MTEENLSDRYQPQEVEKKVYSYWESSGYFKAEEKSTKPPFSIILPPPNVTGFLHLGHGLDHTIQDLLIRWKRMSGYNAMWLPGTDHAGIATQAVVEKELKKSNITRHQLGREKFVEKVWDWKLQYGNRIYEQMRRLGNSCDWDRATFTLDEGVSSAVRKVFTSLYKKGWIYKGQKLVNWSSPLESAISDLEVEYKTTKGTLWHILYPLADGSGHLTVATTRPETLLGDTALCVNPNDERYKSLIGKDALVPLTERKIKIIADTYVDQTFGSGVVKITPAHDFNDFKIGKTHKLEFINLLNRNGTLNENAASYQGLKVAEARKKIVVDLKEAQLLVKEEPYTNSVGHCSRTDAVVEPFMSEQWFVKAEHLAIPAKHAVENGSIRFEPQSWTKVYLHWMNNIEDWCISRQLWWGHRIPAWTCQDCQHINVAESTPETCSHCGKTNLIQDNDVLDTWFSSALWPFSTMGWPQETELQKTFYPTSVLVTGHDIIFFWVARMIMMGIEFKRDIPFRTVYLHGIVRDSQGRKMSKSLGNALDPVELVDKYGADSLRFALLAHLFSGKDLKVSEQRIEGYRNFMNKIWNAARFSLQNLSGFKANDYKAQAPEKALLTDYDQWIIHQLGALELQVEKSLESERYSDAAQALYHFVWNLFCDWYIEFSKSSFTNPATTSEQRQATQYVLAHVLNRIVRLLHPFCPFITEEIYSKLPIKNKACIIDQYPTAENDSLFLSLGDAQTALDVELVKEVISAIRNIRGENRISPAIKLKIRVGLEDAYAQKVLSANRQVIMSIGRLDELVIGSDGDLKKCAVAQVVSGKYSAKVIIPLEGLVDFDEEIKRINKALEKLDKDIALLSGKLANERYLQNADEEMVEADKLLLAQSKTQIITLKDSLTRFE
jgi:valyl-tRNA synthetase